ncbi:hypothetical protein DFH28DRAFT_1118772 [Melampsora americana]|nr:hypothetical protein DFH28DRAFT_1118772 [Melampsora americana]
MRISDVIKFGKQLTSSKSEIQFLLINRISLQLQSSTSSLSPSQMAPSNRRKAAPKKADQITSPLTTRKAPKECAPASKRMQRSVDGQKSSQQESQQVTKRKASSSRQTSQRDKGSQSPTDRSSKPPPPTHRLSLADLFPQHLSKSKQSKNSDHPSLDGSEEREREEEQEREEAVSEREKEEEGDAGIQNDGLPRGSQSYSQASPHHNNTSGSTFDPTHLRGTSLKIFNQLANLAELDEDHCVLGRKICNEETSKEQFMAVMVSQLSSRQEISSLCELRKYIKLVAIQNIMSGDVQGYTATKDKLREGDPLPLSLYAKSSILSKPKKWKKRLLPAGYGKDPDPRCSQAFHNLLFTNIHFPQQAGTESTAKVPKLNSLIVKLLQKQHSTLGGKVLECSGNVAKHLWDVQTEHICTGSMKPSSIDYGNQIEYWTPGILSETSQTECNLRPWESNVARPRIFKLNEVLLRVSHASNIWRSAWWVTSIERSQYAYLRFKGCHWCLGETTEYGKKTFWSVVDEKLEFLPSKSTRYWYAYFFLCLQSDFDIFKGKKTSKELQETNGINFSLPSEPAINDTILELNETYGDRVPEGKAAYKNTEEE